MQPFPQMVALVSKPLQTKPLPASRRAFRSRLVKWFEQEGKDYPWRRTRDPYEVLVSEIMLQQTQIATVLGKSYYQRFLKAFPTLEDLASAKDESLLKAWEGLGYYRRVRMLRETARAVLEHHDGVFPSDLDALLQLPGVGRYTAGALRAFAFGVPAVLVDGNVSRVLSRLMDYREAVDSTAGQKQIWEWAGELADDQHPMSYHSALMELGQRICTSKKPSCASCPVACCCSSKDPEMLPRKKTKTKVSKIQEHAIWQRDDQGRILMHRETGTRRKGLWKLPLRDPSELEGCEMLMESSYGITRYRVSLRVHQTESVRLVDGDAWIEASKLSDLAMAAPFRKVVERLLAE